MIYKVVFTAWLMCFYMAANPVRADTVLLECKHSTPQQWMLLRSKFEKDKVYYRANNDWVLIDTAKIESNQITTYGWSVKNSRCGVCPYKKVISTLLSEMQNGSAYTEYYDQAEAKCKISGGKEMDICYQFNQGDRLAKGRCRVLK